MPYLKPPSSEDQGLTVAEYARILRVDPARLHDCIDSGELEVFDASTPGVDSKNYRILPHHRKEFEAKRSTRTRVQNSKPE